MEGRTGTRLEDLLLRVWGCEKDVRSGRGQCYCQAPRREAAPLSRQPRPVLVAGLFGDYSRPSTRPWPSPGLTAGRVVAERVGPEDTAGPGPKPEAADARAGRPPRSKKAASFPPAPAASAAGRAAAAGSPSAHGDIRIPSVGPRRPLGQFKLMLQMWRASSPAPGPSPAPPRSPP